MAGTFVLASTGCATTMTVSSHARYGLDMQPYRTYDWGPADALPTGDPRLDRNAFFKDHMDGAVEKGLAARGFERAAVGTTPDLSIHYHAAVTRRLDVDRLYPQFRDCAGADCRERVVEFEAGTLVLDVVETRTNRLVWRGWAQVRLEALLDNPNGMGRAVREAIALMLQRLPAHRPEAPGPGTARVAAVSLEDRP
jgi:hypothetical protein